MRDIGYPSTGERPWSEIAAWQQCSGVELSPWESQLIYRLFIRYSSDKYKFEQKPHEPAPFYSDINERRQSVGDGLEAMLMGMN